MSKQIIVYTTKDCIECNMVKQMLSQLNIAFEVKDVSDNLRYQSEVESLGFLGVPVTVIGNAVIKGYRPEEIMKWVKQNHLAQN